jgi:hypothetical protein
MDVSYRRALATPGARRFVGAAFVGRLPISMFGLGTILLVQHATGSYGLAGAVAALGAVAEAAVAPRLGRLLDRFGQSRVLPWIIAVHVIALAALVTTVQTGLPRPVWFVCAVFAGAALPPIGACVRARWSRVLSGSPLLQVAFALESVLDEVVFVVGPALVTALSVGVSPVAGLAAAGTFAVSGGIALAVQHSSDPGPRAAGAEAPVGFAPPADIRTVLVALFCAGAAFGSVDVSMVAFSRAHGAGAAAGLLVGLVATGSLISGLVYGARAHRLPLARRYLIATAFTAAGMSLPMTAPSLPVMVPIALVTGLTVAPTLIGGFAIVEEMTPAAGRTEGFAWLTTAIAAGVAVGSPSAGRAVDVFGPRAGFVVVAGCGLAVALAAFAGRGGLRPPREKAERDRPLTARPTPSPSPQLDARPVYEAG